MKITKKTLQIFQSLRGRDCSQKEIKNLLIEKIQDFITEKKLQKFQTDLMSYLAAEKIVMKQKFSDEDIENANLKRKENGKPIPKRGGLGNSKRVDSSLKAD